MKRRTAKSRAASQRAPQRAPQRVLGLFHTATALLLCGLLAACGRLAPTSDATIAHHQRQFEQAVLQSQAGRTGSPSPGAEASAVRHDPSRFLGVLAPTAHGDPLPPRCADKVTLRVRSPLGLAELAGRLSQILDVPVQLDPLIFSDPDDHSLGQKILSFTGSEGPPGFSAARPPPTLPVGSPVIPVAPAMIADLEGSCIELIDHIASQFDVTWRMQGGALSFDKYSVRVFPIQASSTSSQFSATLTAGGNGAGSAAPGGGSAGAASGSGTSAGGSGGGTAQSTSVTLATDVWTEIDTGLKTLLAGGGAGGAKYTLGRSAGTVTVWATPRVMRDIAGYLEQMNLILGQTIAVEVSAIYIMVQDSDNYGLDLNALYQAGSQSVALSGLLPSLSQTAGTGSIAILSPPAGSNNFATHFAGSQVFLNAVSSSNRLADYRSATVSGRNGVAMPVTLTTSQDIVRSLQFAVGLQSGAASTSASTSTINYGFSLEILPRLVAPGVVSVFLSFTANDLTNLTNFSVGSTGTLELATIDNRSLWNESQLRVGQTLVIAGTEQQRVNPQSSGIGDAEAWLLGGQMKNSVNRTRLILLVTPSLLASPA